VCEDVQGKNCLTTFHGMSLTTDKTRSMVKKWQTLIEGNVDVKTTDGFLIRVFCIGFTRKQDSSTKKTCYAQAQQVRTIRKKMIDIITREVSSTDLKEVVNKLIPDSIARDVEKACQGIYPLHDVHIQKVKVIRRPRFDLAKLMDMHGEGSGKAVATTDPTTGEVVERPEGYEPPVMEAV
jgi:small subunit ribosomal protein S3Ae